MEIYSDKELVKEQVKNHKTVISKKKIVLVLNENVLLGKLKIS